MRRNDMLKTAGSWSSEKFLLIVLMLFSLSSAAQGVKVNAGFLSDSVKVGEQTAFYLATHYPSDLNILFPDSTFGFTPFEYSRRTYFTTETKNGISVDSAVYYLATFEVDRVQYLDLPVFMVQPQDCTVLLSQRDSVLITQMVSEVPDSLSADKLPLKMNTAYQPVPMEFNWWIALIVLGVLIVLIILAWIFFGKKIRAYFVARQLKRKHFQFLQAYNSILTQLQSNFSAISTESALSAWKKYMEQLESRPYTKLTTAETFNLIHDDTLAQNLRTLDKAIYGHNTSVVESLNDLKVFADRRFSKKLEEVKHG
jgi:hypothetical protein